MIATGCSSNPFDAPPPTIEPAAAAVSPPATTRPAGEVLPLGGRPQAALFDARTASLVVFAPGPDPQTAATLTVFGPSGPPRPVPLPGPASALAVDGQGSAYLATRGGYFTVDLAAGTARRVAITDAAGTDFTAIARRADGHLVLGSADGAAYTLATDTTVAEKVKIFARVDAIVTDGDNAVVLDRGQTSVTALNSDGKTQQALRAGEGATTLASDPLGRVLVADTRGGQLLVFGVDPLIERQAYPVPRGTVRIGRIAESRLGFADRGECRHWLRSRYWNPRGKGALPDRAATELAGLRRQVGHALRRVGVRCRGAGDPQRGRWPMSAAHRGRMPASLGSRPRPTTTSGSRCGCRRR